VKKVDGKGDPRRPAIEGGMPTRGEPLPFCRASIDDRDVAAVVETVSSGWLTVGPRTEELERRLADYLSVRHVVAVSSCSEAMFLALSALGVGPGDEVITSCLTFASTVHAIVHTGARPVLADVEMETFGLDPAHVESLITPATRAILPVHFGGQACRIEEIVDLAGRRGLHVVEDAAHSFGAEVGGTPLGAFGDATAFSFYATKNLTTGEGGAISTDSDELAERLRLLSYHGMSRDSWTRYTDRGSWYYQVELPGYKCNLNDMQAALGLSQLDKIDEMLQRRRALAARFHERLHDCPYVDLPATREGNTHSWHLYVVRLKLERLSIDRDKFIQAMTEENIGTSVHFIPVHHHPFFAPYLPAGASFPRCDDYYSRCVSLPIYPGMTDDDLDDAARALVKVAEYYGTD
jgi:dTDP-4-amino-4,6-dideoxygalactose transaminase